MEILEKGYGLFSKVMVHVAHESNHEDDEFFIIEVEDLIQNPEMAVMEAIKEFLNSEKGGKIALNEKGGISWSDVFWFIPKNFWAKHGIRVLNEESPQRVISVSQAENLLNLIE